MKRSSFNYILFRGILLALLLLPACDFIGDLTGDNSNAKNDNILLFPVRINGEWGYINQNGRIMIEPDFSSASSFSEGLARVREGSVGYINPNGDYAIERRFEDGRSFSEDLAAVKMDGRWGFINKSGAFAINPQYYSASSFREGRAFVLTTSYDWEYIDKAGNIIRTLETPNLDDFETDSNLYSSGLALARKSNQYGYLNRDGNVAINFQFAEARAFHDGMAAIKISDSWGFIGTKGQTMISPRYIEAGNFGEGLVPVRENTNEWGYADKEGRMVITPQFEDALPFSEGRAAVLIDGFWGFIDKSGKLVGKADYDAVSSFEKGAALVIIEKINPDNEEERLQHYGYLGIDGKLIWYPTR